MQWPGTELRRSEWFTDVQQALIERHVTMSASDYVGHLSTVSAYLVLPRQEREQVFSRIMRVLPERVEMTADLTLHLARRRSEDEGSPVRRAACRSHHSGHHLDHGAPRL
jgi:hypothetical protein